MLLFTLTLLPTAPIAAPGFKPTGEADVTVDGDITSDGETYTLDMREGKRSAMLYGSAVLCSDLVGEGWDDFEDGRKLGISIDESGETEIYYSFGRYTQDDVDEGIIIDRYIDWSKYQLEGYGQWEGESIPYGEVVASGDFIIYQRFYTQTSKKKGKGATGVAYVEVWSGELSFTVTIVPFEEG